ncbi:MAG: cytochrome c biogenesis protein CcsA [Pirellulaceae bacterium]|nr:cytochrome c biogenesis protein CcsA [Pirellulaceae bacterium]
MLSGVTTVCFAASYAVAWALELSRLAFRSRARGLAMIVATGAGLIAHTAFLYYRAAGAAGAPLSSERDWYLMAAWALVAMYLYLALSRPKTPFGLFLLPLALALIGAGTFLASPQPIDRDSASRVWGTLHGGAILLAAVAVLIGFVAGLMYLGKAWRLKRKRLPTGGLSLPSLEWLGWANSRAIVVAVAMLAAGIVAGSVLNLINISDPAARLGWNDPVVASTWLMFLWLLAAVALVARHRPARQGRKVAYLTLAAVVFLALVLIVGLTVETKHWGRRHNDESRRMNDELRPPAAFLQPSSFILHPSPGGPPC